MSEFEEIINEILDLHKRKSSDYGRAHDPFANVRASEDFGIPGWVGCAVRMNDKMRRLQAAAQGSTMQNESIEDSFYDLAVYSVIGLVLYRQSKEKNED